MKTVYRVTKPGTLGTLYYAGTALAGMAHRWSYVKRDGLTWSSYVRAERIARSLRDGAIVNETDKEE